jgi:hypothetical protein
METILPIIIMSESFAAGLIYLAIGRSGESVYWLQGDTWTEAVEYAKRIVGGWK